MNDPISSSEVKASDFQVEMTRFENAVAKLGNSLHNINVSVTRFAPALLVDGSSGEANVANPIKSPKLPLEGIMALRTQVNELEKLAKECDDLRSLVVSVIG